MFPSRDIKVLKIAHIRRTGLPTPDFQMGFMKVQMGYFWGTFLFRMGYILEVHYFTPDMENLIEKIDEIIRLSYKKHKTLLFYN